MGRSIQLFRKLNVLPGRNGGIILCPSTEPSSTLTSTTLELEIRKAGLQTPAIVELNAALALIPGSTVEYMDNTNSPIQRFFVLPAQEMDCECDTIDYYNILRQAARLATDEEKKEITTCSAFDDYENLIS